MIKRAIFGTAAAIAIAVTIYGLGRCGWQIVSWLAKFM